MVGHPYRRNISMRLIHIYSISTFMNKIQEDYDPRSIVGIKGRHIGESVLDYLPEPPDGWPTRGTQHNKLESDQVKHLLLIEVIKHLATLQSLSNDAGHYSIGSEHFYLPTNHLLRTLYMQCVAFLQIGYFLKTILIWNEHMHGSKALFQKDRCMHG
jgi:hypothetical protein